MVDKVRPLKVETISNGGGVDDMRRTAADPDRNYLACKGIAFENDDNTLLEKDTDGDIVAISNGETTKLRSPIPLIIALG
jgi:hypothetical protein